jgi:hypothetical protein
MESGSPSFQAEGAADFLPDFLILPMTRSPFLRPLLLVSSVLFLFLFVSFIFLTYLFGLLLVLFQGLLLAGHRTLPLLSRP